MAPSLYLINPRSETPSYFGGEMLEHWGFAPSQGIADLAVATVAALVPDHWHVDVCDEYVSPVDLSRQVDFVGITGKITQGSRMIALADEFRRRGRRVVIGGPYASLSPEVLRPHCDVLVVGELEELATELFADLERGDYRSEYVAERPDLTSSPTPRWELYPHGRTLEGCVQTSRGCPFECEFCDVIQYLGRKQRHKSVEQVLAELDALYALGFRTVFLADDNFTAYRKRAKELLAALADWNRFRPAGPVAFSTQLSIDAAKDEEIMALLAAAGMAAVFIGLETPNEESLRESRKRQNVGVDLLERVGVFLDHGIVVTAGMIVGFDHDGLDIFERQYRFAMASPIPIFSLGALVAPAATPLYARMAASGRLVERGSEVAATPWDTNILPVRMMREELFTGLRWLCNNLYTPESFGRRTLQMIARLAPPRGPVASGGGPRRIVEDDAFHMLRRLVRHGPEERRMWAAISRAIRARPHAAQAALGVMIRYAQVRCLYEVGRFWEPHLAGAGPFASPDAASTPAGRGLVSLGGAASVGR